MNVKQKSALSILFATCAAFSAGAQQFTPATDLSHPPDEKKISYALGMNLGLQIQRIGADVDVDVIARAIKDVLDNKPTELKASELRPLFKQEENIELVKISARNRSEAEAFLVKNAKLPGITALSDGLQYRILKAGTGETPKSDATVTVKYKGTLIDGTEFDHRDQLRAQIPKQIKGWQEALRLMPVGSRWQIFLPPDLAYGHNWAKSVGPDSAVIFEIELVSIDQPSATPSDDGNNVVHPIPADATTVSNSH